jgi:hypothetical protein
VIDLHFNQHKIYAEIAEIERMSRLSHILTEPVEILSLYYHLPLPQSSSTFLNPSTQSDNYRIEEPDNGENKQEDE